jgi:hypothetical protein
MQLDAGVCVQGWELHPALIVAITHADAVTVSDLLRCMLTDKLAHSDNDHQRDRITHAVRKSAVHVADRVDHCVAVECVGRVVASNARNGGSYYCRASFRPRRPPAQKNASPA